MPGVELQNEMEFHGLESISSILLGLVSIYDI